MSNTKQIVTKKNTNGAVHAQVERLKSHPSPWVILARNESLCLPGGSACGVLPATEPIDVDQHQNIDIRLNNGVSLTTPALGENALKVNDTLEQALGHGYVL